MERLPLELAWLVYEHLEDIDLAPTPYSEFTEEPSDQIVYGNISKPKRRLRTINWLQHTKVSHSDVLNARLVSSVFYSASHKTFASLLANRTFRLTSVGFQDLVLLSRKKELVQHVRTLTLGCAAFRRRVGINESGSIWPCSFLSGLKVQDRSRLAAAYTECRDWQHHNTEAHTKSLASILRSMPRLDGIRIATLDLAFHLGGWLKPGDEDLLFKGHFFCQDGYSETLIQHYDPSVRPRTYINEDHIMRDCIIEAIKLSQLALRDFRAYPKPCVFDIVTAPFVTPALHTLRIVLDKRDMAYLDLEKWSDIFRKAGGLTDLSLAIDPAVRRGGDQEGRPRHKDPGLVAEWLFQALGSHSRLQRIRLSGGWLLPEAAVVSLVEARVDSLRCLILDEPLLLGNWDSALRSIACITHGRPMFLKVWLPKERRFSPIPSGMDWEASLGFSHQFVWVTESSMRAHHERHVRNA